MRGPSLSTILLAAITVSPPVWSQQPTQDPDDAVARQLELIETLEERIEGLETRIAELEDALRDVTAQQGTANAALAQRPAPDDAVAGGDAGVTSIPEETEADRREQERLVRAAFQRTLIDRGGLLLPPGTIDIQPSVSYLHSSSENIVIDGFTILPVLVVGDIVSERVERNLSRLTTTFRFGLPWDSQLELTLPYSYQKYRRFSADGMETTISDADFGDIEIGFSHQLYRSESLWPDLLGSVRWKGTSGTSPFDLDPEQSLATGTGYDSISLALTAVKVVDPVVYFGSLTYARNYKRTELIGQFDPGDSIGISLGMAIALNLNNSLSLSYDQQSTRRSRIDGENVPGTYFTTGLFSVGSSFSINDFLTVDLSLGLGVTADSPDLQIAASFPFRVRY